MLSFIVDTFEHNFILLILLPSPLLPTCPPIPSHTCSIICPPLIYFSFLIVLVLVSWPILHTCSHIYSYIHVCALTHMHAPLPSPTESQDLCVRRSKPFWVLVTALCKMISHPTHFLAIFIISLFFLVEYNCIVYTYHVFIIYSSLGGHLGWFHFLTVVNWATERNP